MDWTQILHAIFHIDQSMRQLVDAYGVLFYLILFCSIVFCRDRLPAPVFSAGRSALLFVCGAFCANGVLNLRDDGCVIRRHLGACAVNYRIGLLLGARA